VSSVAPGGAGALAGSPTVAGGVVLGRAVTVRVPASSANLGPGFDSLGLAFGVHDLVTVEALPADGAASVEVAVTGEGAGTLAVDESHLVVRSLRSGLARAGAAQPRLRLRCRNRIPHGRGLGSSSAAIAAGLVAARGLLEDPDLLDGAAVLELATAAEGHPDNAAATLFGGFTIAWTEGADARGGASAVRVPLDARVRAVLCVPDGELATSRARAMLPARIPHADGAFNAGRSALLVEALSRSPHLLLPATDDRLHQDPRAPAMPGTIRLLRAVREAGAAAVVSGAGPSLLVLGTGDGPSSAVDAALADGGAQAGAWKVLTPPIDTEGTVVVTDSS
jgi:homoserine kinase